MKQNNLIVGIVLGVILTAFVFQVYTIYSFQAGLISHRRVIADLEQTVEEIEQFLTQAPEEGQPAEQAVQMMPIMEEENDLFFDQED